ncbi:MAG: ATP-binding protein [Gammaproteobacteria bacterium]|nr:ATP-binding protein [Gammaproteobacteria bacterium]MYK81258.1 ATP-binding protein [Gammaproteobacteria bacterium]
MAARSPESLQEKLSRLASSGERSDPLVFSGRGEEIKRIVRAAGNLPPDGARGQTFVIEGAPGAGKTALVHELARRLSAAGVLTVIRENVPSDETVMGVYHALLSAMSGVPNEEARTTRRKETAVTGGVGGVMSGKRVTSESVAPQAALDAAMIAERCAPERLSRIRSAVVFVDEVQNLQAGSGAATLLADLHTQGKLPVLLVCAGLSTSPARLADAGISRVSPSCRIRLGRLAASEAVDCARRTLALSRQWGVDAPDEEVKVWAENIAEASDLWPRHLQCYLQAVWASLAEQDAPSLASASLEDTLAKGRELREAYYLDRLSNSGVPLEVAGRLHGCLADGGALDLWAATDLAGEAIDERLSARARERVRNTFPTDSDCFDAMLKSGLVSLDERDLCISPIPSMTEFILDRCEGLGIQLARS